MIQTNFFKNLFVPQSRRRTLNMGYKIGIIFRYLKFTRNFIYWFLVCLKKTFFKPNLR